MAQHVFLSDRLGLEFTEDQPRAVEAKKAIVAERYVETLLDRLTAKPMDLVKFAMMR